MELFRHPGFMLASRVLSLEDMCKQKMREKLAYSRISRTKSGITNMENKVTIWGGNLWMTNLNSQITPVS